MSRGDQHIDDGGNVSGAPGIASYRFYNTDMMPVKAGRSKEALSCAVPAPQNVNVIHGTYNPKSIDPCAFLAHSHTTQTDNQQTMSRWRSKRRGETDEGSPHLVN